VSSSIVLIGPSGALPSLRERLAEGADVRAFTDTQTREAVDHIVRAKPRIVALEQGFSSTSRGMALVERVKGDPELSACEIRVVAHDGALDPVSKRTKPGAPGGVALDDRDREQDPEGTRYVPRAVMRDGVEALVDGNPVSLIDLSTTGAQVLSTKMLKPNQQVRMTFADAVGTVRCSASIIWASFEMPKGVGARYRAGIALTGVDHTALLAYASRHKREP
jgi:hypothetical protein